MSQIDPLWHALSKLRRGKYVECIAICDELLANNPNDQVRTLWVNSIIPASNDSSNCRQHGWQNAGQ
jgi:hypothetical protein